MYNQDRRSLHEKTIMKMLSVLPVAERHSIGEKSFKHSRSPITTAELLASFISVICF